MQTRCARFPLTALGSSVLGVRSSALIRVSGTGCPVPDNLKAGTWDRVVLKR